MSGASATSRTTKRFSVIVPTYNYGRFVGTAIESILSQKTRDDEVIVVDDASTDDTQEVLTTFGGEIILIRLDENVGPGGAWGVGLSRAKGQFVNKLDADDWYLPGALNRFEAAFNESPSIGMVAAGVYAVHEVEGRVFDIPVETGPGLLDAGRFRRQLIRQFFFHMPGTSLRRSALRDSLPRSDLWMPHDWEYFIRVMRDWSCLVVQEPLAAYRVHGGSVTRTADQDRRLQSDLLLLSDLALDPDSALQMTSAECDLFHLGLGEVYLRLLKVAASSPGVVVQRLRFAQELCQRSSGNGLVATASLGTRVALDKLRTRRRWNSNSGAPSLEGLTPVSTAQDRPEASDSE